MTLNALRRVLFGVLAGVSFSGIAVAQGALPSAAAADPCTASGLAITASGVLSAAGGYLDEHPGANDVLTAAAEQPPEDGAALVRGYFAAHPGEFLDLQGIARPLTALRSQCGVAVSPGQLATLVETLS